MKLHKLSIIIVLKYNNWNFIKSKVKLNKINHWNCMKKFAVIGWNICWYFIKKTNEIKLKKILKIWWKDILK